jgi:hypothetical protein
VLDPFAFGAVPFTDTFLAFFASGAAGSSALALARDVLPLEALPLETRLLETLPLDATLRATFAFFAGRFAARALLAGVRVPAFAVDRFFAAMSILIIRYRDR